MGGGCVKFSPFTRLNEIIVSSQFFPLYFVLFIISFVFSLVFYCLEWKNSYVVTLCYLILHMQFRTTNRVFTWITHVSTHSRCLIFTHWLIPQIIRNIYQSIVGHIYTHVFPYCHALRASLPLMVLIVIHATQISNHLVIAATLWKRTCIKVS